MSSRRFAILAAIFLAVAFLASNLIVATILRSWRVDLTADQLYSLSPGAKRVLADLSEPLELRLYYSRDAAADDPQFQAYGARVREMLRSFAARSRGKLRLREIDVKPYTPAEDAAVEAGLRPMTLRQGDDPIYFGLVGVNAIDDEIPIPAFAPEREAFLEYEITRLIFELESPEPSRIALITALPLDPMLAQDPRFAGSGAQSLFATELGRIATVEKLEPDFAEIPADAEVLVIIHPPPLSDAQSFAIDQFLMRKGRAFVALDPASLAASALGGQGAPSVVPTSSNLEPLLSAWGVSLSDDVVMDLEGALPIAARDDRGRPVETPYPLFIRLPPEQMDPNDLMTAWLRRGVHFGLTGAFTVSPRDGLTETILARTTARTMPIAPSRALSRPQPNELLLEWLPTAAKVEHIAIRLDGTLPSAFPNGPPADAASLQQGETFLTQSVREATIVLVADADFLEDPFYVDGRGAVGADNGSFALNAIDVLSGSDALVSLRSRAPRPRTMDTVERMESEADRRIVQRLEQYQAELQDIRSRLAQLQARGSGSGVLTGSLATELRGDELAELERYRAEEERVRTELRNTERDLRADIDRLEAWVVFINMWLGPILIAGAGLFVFWRSQRRGRSAAK